jgi:uncharacterized CHY-type Zn-finger protein
VVRPSPLHSRTADRVSTVSTSSTPRLPSAAPAVCDVPSSGTIPEPCNSTITDHPAANRRARIAGKKWFDCAECHHETEDHPLLQQTELTFACKKCKKCFRKDAAEFDESDEYCPRCDNHFVIDAVTPKPRLEVEGEDVRKDARMLKDERIRGEEERSIFNVKDASNRLG